MKKNLISILILALLVVNVALTAVMMFSVMGTAKKTGALVDSISTVLNLELEKKQEEEDTGEVSIADAMVHDIQEDITIPLKKSEDGKDHYCIVNVSVMMNTKHEDYATYYANIVSQESIMKSIVIDVIGSRTLEEAKADPEAMKNDILQKIQEAYDSTFIYKVVFSNILYQ